jgi:3-oxoacyl-[acyl-carrier-protein] synthase-3
VAYDKGMQHQTSSYRSQIRGVGAYVPTPVVTNHDLTAFMDTSDEWIIQRSGIRERRWALPDQSNTDLAYEASQIAIAKSGIPKEQIDLIIYATLSPDYTFPGNGCFLGAKMEMPGVPALDIRQQCSGFIYGLSIADQYIRTGTYQNILVVGSEVHSRGLDKSTRGRDVSVLFGDGAGAVVVSRTELKDPQSDRFLYSTRLHSDGRGAKNLWTPAPGCAMGPTERIDIAMIEQGLHYPKMDGKKVFVEAVTRMSEVLAKELQANALGVSDIDLFFFHQANLRINEAVAEQMKIPREKVFNTIQRFGNTTAATIPLGMYTAIEEGHLKPGMRIALAAFGSGYTWAAGVLRF